MRGEVLGVERRRRWSDEEKLEIVSSVGVAGATVTRVAQRNDITRQQIYAWRHELKKKGLWSPEQGAVFLPVDVPTFVFILFEPGRGPPGSAGPGTLFGYSTLFRSGPARRVRS